MVYRVLFAEGNSTKDAISKLEEKAKLLLRIDYIPQGGISTVYNQYYGHIEVSQAFIRQEKP